MARYYCINKIAIEIVPQIGCTEKCFMYEKKTFKLLIDVNNIQQLIKDIKKTTEFDLKIINDNLWESDNYLGLFVCFSTKNNIGFEISNAISKLRIISQFFKISNTITNRNETCANTTDNNLINDISSVQQLYNMLLVAHHSYDSYRDNKNIPNDVQHHKLKPKLRQYQSEAVKWMLNRELNDDYFEDKIIEIYAGKYNTAGNQLFFLNSRTFEISDHKPLPLKIPSGGILADEMGLGKTVEILDLILCNPKRNKRKINDDDDVITTKPKTRTITKLLLRSSETEIQLFCLCKLQNYNKLIKCTKCAKYQHKECVWKYTETYLELDEKAYICPECWKYEKQLESSTTFIVSPNSISAQWYTEILQHINDSRFKVLLYNGIKKSGWINPMQLCKYDIVITDYNIMTTEIYFSKHNESNTSLRNKRNYITPISPLTCLKWWRVCLDEAQLVDTPTRKCSKMVKLLPAVHRWAVTGTPIEKSIDNLYGLIYFIDCEPYTNLNVWKEITTPFLSGNAMPLVEVLKKIMWRTCKSEVLDQIKDIPEQTEVIHYVKLSSLELFYYEQEHRRCAERFREKANKLEKSLAMSKMNSHTLKLIMEPLRKLRQDCTVQSIFLRERQVKKFLTPKELSQHLLSNTEIECKSILRSIVLSLNGLAALHILKDDPDNAINLYETVLRRAKDCKDSISVDSLLQIHAVYNLIDIMSQKINEYPASKINDYKKESVRLEWKYMEKLSISVGNVYTQTKSIKNDIKKMGLSLHENCSNWIINVLQSIDAKKGEELINKIQCDILTKYHVTNNLMKATETYQFQLDLILWLDKIFVARDEVENSFNELEFLLENIKPKDQLSEQVHTQITRFITNASECHIKYLNNKKKTCLLCRAEDAIKNSACNLFQTAVKNNKIDVVSWSPRYQEAIVNFLFSVAKRDKMYENIIEEAETFMSWFNTTKRELKEYSKLWVELENAVLGYDELNICTSRMQAYDPELCHPLNKQTSLLLIPKNNIDSEIIDLKTKLDAGELDLSRKLSQRRYLKYLTEKDEFEMCSICYCKPENGYGVLQCGHAYCMLCLLRLNTLSVNKIIKCSLCRYTQLYSTIHYTSENAKYFEDNKCVGDYSSKIEVIINEIIKLKNEDSSVKIIIFSHWKNILEIVSNALLENSITFRLKCNLYKKSISDFQNLELNITCLLLPLAYGSKGLNLIEATHVFLVEPILNPSDELQAIGRVHRIGQFKSTYVHKFIIKNTIEETICNTISNDKSGKWQTRNVSIDNLYTLFNLNTESNVKEIVNNLQTLSSAVD